MSIRVVQWTEVFTDPTKANQYAKDQNAEAIKQIKG